MQNSVVLLVNHDVTTVEGSLHRDVYAGLRDTLSYPMDDFIWAVKSAQDKNGNWIRGKEWMADWDGRKKVICYNKAHCKCFNKKDGTHFPTGLLGLAKDFFREQNIQIKFKDIRKVEGKSLSLSTSSDF